MKDKFSKQEVRKIIKNIYKNEFDYYSPQWLVDNHFDRIQEILMKNDGFMPTSILLEENN